VLELRHMLLGGGLLRERPGQHEFGLEDRPGRLYPAVQGGAHPSDSWVPNMMLHVGNDLSGIGLVPTPVQLLSSQSELDEKVGGEVLRLDLAAFFPPKPQEGGLIVPHDDPGVRAADEVSPPGCSVVVWDHRIFINNPVASQPRRATLDVIRRAFESAGVEFIDENGGGPGVRLRKRTLKKE
jgi:hypothetical protein